MASAAHPLRSIPSLGLTALLGALSSPSGAWATDLQRRVVRPVAFLPGARFVYRQLDLACRCEGTRCLYVDEAGETPCVPELLVVQDLTSDRATQLDRTEAAALDRSAPPPPARQGFPLFLDGDVLDIALGSGCNPPEGPRAGTSPGSKCRVLLQSRQHGRKVIGTFETTWSPAHRISVIGYHRSSTEPRIAVVILRRESQFEEVTQSWELVFGADLRRWPGDADAGTR